MHEGRQKDKGNSEKQYQTHDFKCAYLAASLATCVPENKTTQLSLNKRNIQVIK